MATLPMRFRLLYQMANTKTINVYELMEALSNDYGNEGQFTLKSFNNHLASMRAVGLIEEVEVDMDTQGNLLETFAITDFGRTRLKHLPRAWR